ncbi:MAG TPA: hypothetical protein VM029_04255 [Opitutaceae bacterium]|nr:hypothetical protein [Opitutaceae bacterium]
MKQLVFFRRVSTAVILGAALAASAGCNSHNGPRDLMMEEANAGATERPVAMKGEGTFLEGKLAATATVSRGFDRGPGARGRGKGGGSGEEAYGRRGRRDDAGAFTEVYNIYGESEEEQKEAMEEYIRQARARRAAGSPMPPVTLRVQFENKGTEPLEIEVTDVNSDLGNFAVRPPKLVIPPGEKGSLDPMISQLGVTSDEIPLKLVIRQGAKKETQVVVVKNIIRESLKKEFETLRK